MRRVVLLLGALAAPAIAAAQTVASGQILFTDGTNDLVHGPFISAEECQSTTAVVNLSWNTQVTSGSFPAAAKYTLYASNKQSSDTNCIKANNGTDTFAGPIGATLSGLPQVVNLQPFSTSAFVTVSGYTCAIAADTPIYVCVQAYQSDGVTVVGVAKGTLTLSTAIPAAPTGVTATPADTGALEISWTAPAGSPAAYDYRIVATAQTPADDPGSPHQATDIRALSYVMGGLVVGVTYDIAVYGRTQAGNEGPAGTTTGKSVVVADFWDVYHDPPYGGRDSGGCSAGAAGPVALLGVAALLARLRRRR